MKKIILGMVMFLLIGVLSGCSEIASNEEVNEIMNIAGKQLSQDFAAMKRDIDTLVEYADEASGGTGGKLKQVKNKTRVKEINTKTEVVSFQANTLDEWTKEVSAKERALVPAGNYVIINANGVEEYRGYMIVGKEVQSYKKISMEIPVGPSLGKQATKTVYVNLPQTVKYTLHKHEVGNKLTENAIGEFLVGLVNMQFVATQTCDCGYTSKITWEIPDITEMKGNKVTGNEFYVRTEEKVVTK